ncbi:MAG: HAD family hydrolase [Terricaulis sp.]
MTAPCFIFDLDGTLVDNVYEHVAAWKKAFNEAGIRAPTWRIHRRIGMSGERLVSEVAQEAGAPLTGEAADRVHKRHGEIFNAMELRSAPLPGAAALLAHLSQQGATWSIATSGHAENAHGALAALNVDLNAAVVVTGDQVKKAKPAPDLFLEAARRLKRPPAEALVVGDSVWDMQAAVAAGARGVGLRCGGYAAAELEAAGATHVYDDPADLLARIGELMPSG